MCICVMCIRAFLICFIDSITTANSIDYEKCKILQLLRNLFEGGKKKTYLAVDVLELPSLHYLDISPPQNYNIHSFIWSFTQLKKVTMA